MDKYVPVDKRSKKEQKSFNQEQRVYINNLNLGTRTFKDKKHPTRAEEKEQLRKEILENT